MSSHTSMLRYTRLYLSILFDYFFVLFCVTTPRLDNVTDDHCHSRLRSQIFTVSRSGIILTVCFVRKMTLFLAKQTYEKWHHFFGLAKIRSTSPMNDGDVSWHCRSTGSESGVKKSLVYAAASLHVLPPTTCFKSVLRESLKVNKNCIKIIFQSKV